MAPSWPGYLAGFEIFEEVFQLGQVFFFAGVLQAPQGEVDGPEGGVGGGEVVAGSKAWWVSIILPITGGIGDNKCHISNDSGPG